MGLVMRLRPECTQALFATCADAPGDTWGEVAARVEPTPAQRTALRQLWHLYMGRLTTLRCGFRNWVALVYLCVLVGTLHCGNVVLNFVRRGCGRWLGQSAAAAPACPATPRPAGTDIERGGHAVAAACLPAS